MSIHVEVVERRPYPDRCPIWGNIYKDIARDVSVPRVSWKICERLDDTCEQYPVSIWQRQYIVVHLGDRNKVTMCMETLIQVAEG